MPRLPQARSVKTLESILTAAEALMERRGLSSLTMDAVAAEAGISKGGVLHHFRSKEALIAGLVSRRVDAIRVGTEELERSLPEAPGRSLLAMIRYCAHQYGDEKGFPPALLVAATQNADCVSQIAAQLSDTLRRVGAASERPAEAEMLVFASLGMLLCRSLGFSTLSDDEARRIFDAIDRQSRRVEPKTPTRPAVRQEGE